MSGNPVARQWRKPFTSSPHGPSAHTFPIDGFVGDRNTGAGIGGLAVEVWPATGDALAPLAGGYSDEAGAFGVHLPADAISGDDGAGIVEVEVRVTGEGRLLHRETRRLDVHRRDAPVEIYLAPQDSAAARSGPDGLCEVVGHVKGTAPEGARARVLLRSLEGSSLVEREVGTAPVDASGWYELRYACPVDDQGMLRSGLVVQLTAEDGGLLVESVPVRAPPQRARIDLRPPRNGRAPSEFAVLEQHLRSQLGSGPEILDGLESSALDEVTAWLEIEPYRVAMLQRTRVLESQTGVPAELFYAIGHCGMSLELAELVDVSVEELRTTIKEAVARRVVGGNVLENLEPMLDRLAACVAETAVESGLGADPSPHITPQIPFSAA